MFLLDNFPSKLVHGLRRCGHMVDSKAHHFVPILLYIRVGVHDLLSNVPLHKRVQYPAYQLDSQESRDSILHYGNSLGILDTIRLPISHICHIFILLLLLFHKHVACGSKLHHFRNYLDSSTSKLVHVQ